jgi:hypothetical protein
MTELGKPSARLAVMYVKPLAQHLPLLGSLRKLNNKLNNIGIRTLRPAHETPVSHWEGQAELEKAWGPLNPIFLLDGGGNSDSQESPKPDKYSKFVRSGSPPKLCFQFCKSWASL